MAMIPLLISIILVLAVLGVVFWAIRAFALPQPIMIVVYALVAVAALYFLAYVARGGRGLHLSCTPSSTRKIC